MDLDGSRTFDELDSHIVRELRGETDGLTWTTLAAEINEVEARELWRQADPPLRSMNAWVDSVCKRTGRVASYIYRIKKAARTYAGYAERKRAAGQEPVPLSDVTVTDRTLSEAATVCGRNHGRLDAMVDSLLDGQTRPAEVTRMLKHKTERDRARGRKPPANARERDERAAAAPGEDEVRQATADEIVDAIVPETFYGAGELGGFLYRGARRVFDVFPEFPVKTGGASRARRIDALVVSNVADADSQYEVRLAGIEVKVAKSDLVRDEKHIEYEPYVDASYFAVPAELEADAREVLPDGWGLFVYAHGKLTMEEPARHMRGEMREVTLATLVVRLAHAVKVGRKEKNTTHVE